MKNLTSYIRSYTLTDIVVIASVVTLVAMVLYPIVRHG